MDILDQSLWQKKTSQICSRRDKVNEREPAQRVFWGFTLKLLSYQLSLKSVPDLSRMRIPQADNDHFYHMHMIQKISSKWQAQNTRCFWCPDAPTFIRFSIQDPRCLPRFYRLPFQPIELFHVFLKTNFLVRGKLVLHFLCLKYKMEIPLFILKNTNITESLGGKQNVKGCRSL